MFCYRDTKTIEEHSGALISLLDSCLLHDLKPTQKDKDPPHAKIASEVVSCIFFAHLEKPVMSRAVPVAVKLLHRGNKELSRNLSSYLSLAAINHADVLAPHIQPIIDSIISGNYALVRVLPKIYVINPEPIHDHIMALICLLPNCEVGEKSTLLNLFALISKTKPSTLESNLPQLADCLSLPQTAYPTMQIFLDIANANSKPFLDYVNRVISACELNPSMVSIAAEFLGVVGKLNDNKATDCVRFMTHQLSKCDLGTTITLLRQIKSLVELYPTILSSFIATISNQVENSSSSTVQSYLQQLNNINAANVRSSLDNAAGKANSGSHLVNVLSSVKNSFLSSDQHFQLLQPSSTSFTPAKSTSGSGRLGNHNVHIIHRSIPRLPPFSSHSSHSSNVHRSLNALVQNNVPNSSSSRQNITRMSVESVSTATPTSGSQKSASSSYLLALQEKEREAKQASVKNVTTTSIESQLPLHKNPSCNIISPTGTSTSGSHYNVQSGCNTVSRKDRNANISSAESSYSVSNAVPANHDTGTRINEDSNEPEAEQVKVFEPYPMRDAVQHFCEKHIEKIKAYMQKVFVKIPLPVKCTIEERKSKKMAKIYFSCQVKGDNCLYTKSYFLMKTKNARIWIHLMFLALQARAKSALCTREPSVNALKNCWETLKLDNQTFLTLVTSAFPSAKDQEALIEELRAFRFFDVFNFNAIVQLWGCFLCNHPDRATGFLRANAPVIEGELKEKKGKWSLFRRWRTRYFTLSGVHLYRDEVCLILNA